MSIRSSLQIYHCTINNVYYYIISTTGEPSTKKIKQSTALGTDGESSTKKTKDSIALDTDAEGCLCSSNCVPTL